MDKSVPSGYPPSAGWIADELEKILDNPKSQENIRTIEKLLKNAMKTKRKNKKS